MDGKDGFVNGLGPFPNGMEGLRDYQGFHRWLDIQKGFGCELLTTMVCLTEEIGEVAQVVKRLNWRHSLLKDGGDTGRQLGFLESPDGDQEVADPAYEQACAEYRRELGEELADCLAYLCKMANATGIDLEQAYLSKMARNVIRTWAPPKPKEDAGVVG